MIGATGRDPHGHDLTAISLSGPRAATPAGKSWSNLKPESRQTQVAP
jgi:hypothetical protein